MRKSVRIARLILLHLLTACSCSSPRPEVQSLVKADQDKVLRDALGSPSAPVVTDLVIFGDSLSDTGRLRRRTAGLYMPPDVYWQGRVTNGPNWTDYVCGALSCRVDNHAIAGAATRLDAFFLRFILLPLDAQVEEFVNDHPTPLPETTVAVIWMGANNYLKKLDRRPDEVRADIKAAATKLLQGPIQRLLIGSMPQLGDILASPTATDPVSRDAYIEVSQIHNRNIHAVIEELQREFPGKSIALYNAFEINKAAMDNPKDFGFTNIKEACYKGDYLGKYHGEPGFCADYLGFKFWDYTHPNTRMHCYYGARFLLSLHEAGWLESVDAGKVIDRCRQL